MRVSAVSSRASSKMAFAFLPEQSAQVLDSAAGAAGCSQTGMATSFPDKFAAARDVVFRSVAVDSRSQEHQSSSFPEPSQKHSDVTAEEKAQAAEQVVAQLPQPADLVRQSEAVVPQDESAVAGAQVGSICHAQATRKTSATPVTGSGTICQMSTCTWKLQEVVLRVCEWIACFGRLAMLPLDQAAFIFDRG